MNSTGACCVIGPCVDCLVREPRRRTSIWLWRPYPTKRWWWGPSTTCIIGRRKMATVCLAQEVCPAQVDSVSRGQSLRMTDGERPYLSCNIGAQRTSGTRRCESSDPGDLTRLNKRDTRARQMARTIHNQRAWASSGPIILAIAISGCSSSGDATDGNPDAGRPAIIETGARDDSTTDGSPVPIADATPTDGIVADASSATDSPAEAMADVSPNDGTVGDAATTDAALAGTCLRFDGVGAYVALPAADGGASETAFTSELWFKTTAPTGMLFEVYSDGVDGADRSTYLKGGKVCFYVDGSGASEICTTAATFNDSTWHNVAGTLGPSGQRLYVDGTVLGTASGVTASTFNYDTGFRLGYGYIGPSGPLTFFTGYIDDVRLWSVQLNPEQLAARRGMAIDPTTPGLQGYWKLDESGNTTTTPDSVVPAHDGVLTEFSFTISPWVSPGAF